MRPAREKLVVGVLVALGSAAILIGLSGIIYAFVVLVPRLDRAYEAVAHNLSLARSSIDAVLGEPKQGTDAGDEPRQKTRKRSSRVTEHLARTTAATQESVRASAQLVRAIEKPADLVMPESPFIRTAQAFDELATSLGLLTGELRRADRGPSLRAYRDGLMEAERALEAATIPASIGRGVVLNSGLYVLLGLGLLATAVIYSKLCQLLRALGTR